MAKRDDDATELDISPEKVEFIIVKAREFDAKVDSTDPDSGSNASDDRAVDVLESSKGDSTTDALSAAIDGLNDDEVVDLIALAWLGRGDFQKEEWPQARALAYERHRRRSACYLTGMPMLGDYLEEGLAQLGYSTSEFDEAHL